MSNTAMLNTAQ